MKTLTLLLILCTLTACERPAWINAQEDYICTTEQHAKAVAEVTEARKLNLGQGDSYLYSAAIMRNCTLKNDVKPRPELCDPN